VFYFWAKFLNLATKEKGLATHMQDFFEEKWSTVATL
jgi:hypothetical protein